MFHLDSIKQRENIWSYKEDKGRGGTIDIVDIEQKQY